MKTFIGINPATQKVALASRATPEELADAFEQGLIIVPATEDDCREMFGEIGDLHDLCKTAQAAQ